MSHRSAIVRRASRLVEELRALSAETDTTSALPDRVIRDLAEGGFFRMLTPRSIGGLEVEPLEFVEALSTLAQGDSAAAWCAMVGSTTGLATAYLPHDVGQALWAGAEPLAMAGVFAPFGRVERADGGYLLTGRWPFVSGCLHASTFMLGGFIPATESGRAGVAAFFADRGAVEIHGTWKVGGLRGTGSHDVSVSSVFVPDAHVVSLTQDVPTHDGPLFRFPIFGLLACGVAAVGLGIARASLDDFRAQNCRPGEHTNAAKDSLVQVAIAGAEGRLRAARALMSQELERIYRLDGAGRLGAQDAADVRLVALEATAAARAAVDTVYHASGGAAVYERNRQERHFRDIHVLTQHIMVSPRASKLVARVLMGIDTDTSQL